MKIYNSFKEMQDVSKEILNYYENLIENLDIGLEDSFIDTLGGAVHVIESNEDLKEIVSFGHGQDDNLASSALVFDYCNWVSENYIYIFLATNNAGGPTYWIPKVIAEKSNNVLESVRITAEYWS